MLDLHAHPNTVAVLDAWRRLAVGASEEAAPVDDNAELLARLFVLTRVSDTDYSFQRVGASLDALFGRRLADHNFLSLWSTSDRALIAGGLAAAIADAGPVLLRATGETLDGRRASLEFPLAPLLHPGRRSVRFLGLCQCLTNERALGGRPLRRLQASAVYPPAPTPEPVIRIVSSR